MYPVIPLEMGPIAAETLFCLVSVIGAVMGAMLSLRG
jgi:hypothetical protein